MALCDATLFKTENVKVYETCMQGHDWHVKEKKKKQTGSNRWKRKMQMNRFLPALYSSPEGSLRVYNYDIQDNC